MMDVDVIAPDRRPPSGASRRIIAAGSATTSALRSTGVIFVVFVVIVVWIRIKNPNFTDPPVFLNFLRRASPLVILAAGQTFVVAAGGFDLSVGSIVTATAVVAARYSDGDPANTWWLIPLLLAAGALVGLVNGLVVTKLKVPSFIATLAMLLVLAGGIRYWTGGSPTGALADNFRQFGRDAWEGVPLIEVLPLRGRDHGDRRRARNGPAVGYRLRPPGPRRRWRGSRRGALRSARPRHPHRDVRDLRRCRRHRWHRPRRYLRRLRPGR